MTTLENAEQLKCIFEKYLCMAARLWMMRPLKRHLCHLLNWADTQESLSQLSFFVVGFLKHL